MSENGELQKVILGTGQQCCENCPMYKEVEVYHKVDMKYKNSNCIKEQTIDDQL
jgi:hypothetical protein